MKAVIIKIKKNQAAALDDDGGIIKIKNRDYRIGQVIELKKATKKTGWSAAAAVLLLLIGFGTWSFFSPYTYVSLDVNPSIEYSVNRYGLVLSAEAVNGDGEEILSELNLKFQNIDQALADTVDQIAEQGYFDGEDPGAIMIATSCKNTGTSDELCLRLQTRIREMERIQKCAVEVQGVSVGYDRVQEARDLGITPGKLNLIQKLIAGSADPDSISIEDWINMPVKDIMHAINDSGNGYGGSTDSGSGGSTGGTTNNTSGSGSGNTGGSSGNSNTDAGGNGKGK